MKKRFFSLLLVCALILGLVPTVALAAPSASLTVTVQDAYTGDKIRGAGVRLESVSAGSYRDYGIQSTDSVGKVTFTGLVAGVYRLTQPYSTAGYQANPDVVSVSVTGIGSFARTFMNTPKQGIVIQRVSMNGENVGRGRYEVKDNRDSLIGSYTTNDSGMVSVTGLQPGYYYISEVTAPSGSVRDSSVRSVQVLANQDTPVSAVFSSSELGTCSVLLAGIDGPIQGVRFNLSDTHDNHVATATTDAAGIAFFSGLQPGSYIVKQDTVAEGYINDKQSATFTLTAAEMHRSVTLKNDKPGSLRIVCETNDGAVLPEVTYDVYLGNTALYTGLVSDVTGQIILTGLATGDYKVVATPPQDYNISQTQLAVRVLPNATAQVSFEAIGKGDLVISSVQEDGTVVNDVSFRVSQMNGNVVGVYETKNGNIYLPHLDSGVYIIEEIGVPTGYVLETAARKVFIRAGETLNTSFTILRQPYIVVDNFIQDTITPLAGSAFSLYNSAGTKVADGVSGQDGRIIFRNLQPGVYTIRNTAAPNGYSVVTAAQVVTVASGRSAAATFTAMRQSSFVVRSFDNAGNGLAGTQFVIRDAQGVAIESLVTDATGVAVSNSHPAAVYYVQMTAATPGYVPNVVEQKATIINLQNTYVDFTSGAKAAIVVHAYDVTGTPVVGAEYAIADGVTGRELQHITTNEAGVAISNVFTPGMYLVREVTAPTDYADASVSELPVILTANHAASVRFVYQHKGTIWMSSVDNSTDEVLAGAEYTVENAVTGNLVGRYVDNGEGVSTEQLPSGAYFVKQVVAPEGYALRRTSQRVVVIGDSTETCVFRNEKLSGLVIESVAQDNHLPLAGGYFEVYDPMQKQVYCGGADVDGKIYLPDLPAGVYLIKHITAPDGYRVVDTIRKVTITVDGPTTAVLENVAFTGLTIFLMDADTKEPLANFQFKVQTIGGAYVADVTTNVAGLAMVDDLPAGTYMVSQIAAPAGYQLESDYQWAEVKIRENTRVTFTNVRYSGLVISAQELGTGTGLVGVTFQVWEQNGKLVGEFTTDTTGTISSGMLEPGKYLIRETAGPNGYTIMTATQTVEVTHGLNTTAIFYHQPHGTVTVKATNALTNVGVSGAVFDLFTSNDIYIGQYTTGSTGTISFGHLKPGYYKVTCVKAPDGYLLNETTKTFQVVDDTAMLIEMPMDTTSDFKILVTTKQDGLPIPGVTVKVTTLAGKLVGNYVTDENGAIKLILLPGDYEAYMTYGPDGYVLDKQPHNIHINATTKNTLELQVQRLSTIRVKMVDADTKAGIPFVKVEIKDAQNNYVGTYTTDNDGYVYLTDVLKDGRYILTLVDAPTNYIKDTVPKTVEITTAEDTNVIWELNARKGQLTIVTKSATDNAYRNLPANSLLPDAIYTITDENGKVVNTIYGDTWGEAYSGVLPIGTYYIRQIQAPYGYILNSQKVTVNISATNAKVNITVYNKSADVGTSVQVNGPQKANPGSEIKYYFNNVRNTSKVTLPKFLFHIKLPTDAVRAGTLYTGTWTGTSNNYSISYQTNKADYRTLATGLAPTSAYSFDLSSTALKLASGEYVTNIRFEFDNTVGGFHSEQAPTLYCYTLPGLPVGYQVICRTEAAALYNGQWSKAADTWTTTINGFYYGVPNMVVPGGKVITIPAVIPDTLPKTGY